MASRICDTKRDAAGRMLEGRSTRDAAGSRSVSYAHSTVLPSTAATPPAAGDNFSRLSTTTYPSTSPSASTVVTQIYKTAEESAVAPRLLRLQR